MIATPSQIVRAAVGDLAFCDVCGRAPDRVLRDPDQVLAGWRFRGVCAHGAARIGTPEWAKAARVEVVFFDERVFQDVLDRRHAVRALASALKFFRRGFEQYPRKVKVRRVRPLPAYQRRRVRVALRKARV